MKKLLFVLGSVLALGHSGAFAQSRPDKCGAQVLHDAMIAEDPSWAQRLADQKASLQAAADYYKAYKASAGNERTTSTVSPIPVIFHIVVDSAQFLNMGGTSGIIKRCDSQIKVLNADFNHANADSSLIPSSWKSLYSNSGIKFGLAHVDPSGNCSPGYEIRIVSQCGFKDENAAFRTAKKDSTHGLPPWDVTKYYNVWCINYVSDTISCSGTSLLGITVPKSSAFGSNAGFQGVCILYNTLGTTGPTNSCPGTGVWPIPYNLGRTLTHETGHFFEIWHPWGDDGPGTPYSGYCPWAGSTCGSGDGSDDGLNDTPPEKEAVYGMPTYTIAGGTYSDCCEMNGATNTQPIGIACLSYMDYTDDKAMYMFTTDEANVMASMVLVPTGSAGTTAGEGTIGENYSLTQHPGLLVPCGTSTVTAVAPAPGAGTDLNIFPNPTTGQVTVTLNASATDVLHQIIVINILGQEVMNINGQNKDFYTIDLSGMSKGIYFIKCNFSSGNNITKKILLQ